MQLTRSVKIGKLRSFPGYATIERKEFGFDRNFISVIVERWRKRGRFVFFFVLLSFTEVLLVIIA